MSEITTATVEAINAKYAEVQEAHCSAVQRGIELGNMLIEAKKNQSYGSFGYYIQQHFTFSQRHAQRFMKLALDYSKLTPAEATSLSHLTVEEATAAISNASSTAAGVDKPTRKKVFNAAGKDGLTIRQAEKVVERRARKPKKTAEEREQSWAVASERSRQALSKAFAEKESKPTDEQDTTTPTPARLPAWQGARDMVAYVGIDTSNTDAAAKVIHEKLDPSVYRALVSSMIRVDRDPEEVRCTDALTFASIAISQLERIRDDDPLRAEAMLTVAEWIEQNKPPAADDDDVVPDGYEVVEIGGAA